MIKNLLSHSLVLLLAIFMLNACSDDDDAKPITDPGATAEELQASAKELFQKGKAEMDSGNYNKSVKIFQEVERLYPFSNLAPKSRVMSAYSNYKNEEYDKAIAIIDNFIALNPGNDDISFVYYLKALSYYDRISDVKRDQKITKQAKSSFQEVIRRFPGTNFFKDSKFKLDLIRDHLAGKEMEVGRFYLKKKNYIAAVNRFKEVVQEYDDTTQIKESLYRMVEGNLALGLDNEAKKYAAILGHNYPDNIWYQKAYALVNDPEAKKEGGSFFNFFGGSNKIEDDISQPADLQRERSEERNIEAIFEEEVNN